MKNNSMVSLPKKYQDMGLDEMGFDENGEIKMFPFPSKTNPGEYDWKKVNCSQTKDGKMTGKIPGISSPEDLDFITENVLGLDSTKFFPIILDTAPTSTGVADHDHIKNQKN